MEIATHTLLILLIVVFIAGFIDSIAGGGGLLTVPAYLLSGFPPDFALGTNKLVNCSGSGVAIINFIKNNKFTKEILVVGIITAAVGSVIGTKSVLLFDPTTTGKLITFLLPVGMASLLIPKKSKGIKSHVTNRDIYLLTPLICFTFGFYDGFFGPGTGSFLAILFFSVMRLDLTTATGNAKIYNFVSNLGSLITFIFAGKIFYLAALPLIGAAMAGNYLGSYMAIKKGNNFIKIFLFSVLAAIFVIFLLKYIIFS
ncbi:MAG: TSUP family transporter [bacterium]|nr:TSUP family transporter [bacterium]